MALSRSANSRTLSEHAHIWSSLRSAIAGSSGFRNWKDELSTDEADSVSLDYLVRRYLRETLETLAY
ncbi:MAG: hypothetical protein VKI82_08790 [Leptolyngbya sp.]|nr:hypothetical protein [Leptolyngbya sp.]